VDKSGRPNRPAGRLDPPTTGPVVAADRRQARGGQKGQDTPATGGERQNSAVQAAVQIATTAGAQPRSERTAGAGPGAASFAPIGHGVHRWSKPKVHSNVAAQTIPGASHRKPHRVAAAQGISTRKPQQKARQQTGGKGQHAFCRGLEQHAGRSPGPARQGSPPPSSRSSPTTSRPAAGRGTRQNGGGWPSLTDHFGEGSVLGALTKGSMRRSRGRWRPRGTLTARAAKDPIKPTRAAAGGPLGAAGQRTSRPAVNRMRRPLGFCQRSRAGPNPAGWRDVASRADLGGRARPFEPHVLIQLLRRFWASWGGCQLALEGKVTRFAPGLSDSDAASQALTGRQRRCAMSRPSTSAPNSITCLIAAG